MQFQRSTETVGALCRIPEVVRKRVPGHRTGNREGPTTKLAETVTRHEQLLTTDTTQVSTTGDIRDECTAVHQVVATVMWCCRHRCTVSPSLYWTRSGMSSQCMSEYSMWQAPVELPFTTDKTRCSVQHTLQLVSGGFGRSFQHRVTVVDRDVPKAFHHGTEY